jgi:NADPH2:quinone reductase
LKAGETVLIHGASGATGLAAVHVAKLVGARYLIVGWAATPFVAQGKGQRGAPNANQLPTNLIMMKGLDVLGCPTVISTVQDPSIRAPRLAQVWSWAESGQVKPHVSHRFPLAQFKEAMRAKWNGEVIGGAVLNPD